MEERELTREEEIVNDLLYYGEEARKDIKNVISDLEDCLADKEFENVIDLLKDAVFEIEMKISDNLE